MIRQVLARTLSILVLCGYTYSYSVTYRMLVAVTPLAEANLSYPFPSNADGVIPFIKNRVILKTNSAYNSSNSPLPDSYTMPQIELAGIVRVNYTEVNTLTDLDRLRRTDDAYLNEVHALRDKYAADIVMLLGRYGDAGGRAYLAASESHAFQVSDVWSTYFNVTAHENGHIFGCHHNIEESGHASPYTYGHGHLGYLPHDPATWGFHTTWGSIMSYADVLLPWFSNPYQVWDYNGAQRGNVTSANCTRVHHERKSVVAAFRSPWSFPAIFEDTLITGEYAHLIGNNVGIFGTFAFGPTVFQTGSEVFLEPSDTALISGIDNSMTVSSLIFNGRMTVVAARTVVSAYLAPGSDTYIRSDSVKLGQASNATLTVRGALKVEAEKIEVLPYKTVFGAGAVAELSIRNPVRIGRGFSVKPGGKLKISVKSNGILAKKGVSNEPAGNFHAEQSDNIERKFSFTTKLSLIRGVPVISYSVPSGESVGYQIFDIKGKVIAKETISFHSPGDYTRVLSGPFQSGNVYIVRFYVGEYRAIHRFLAN